MATGTQVFFALLTPASVGMKAGLPDLRQLFDRTPTNCYAHAAYRDAGRHRAARADMTDAAGLEMCPQITDTYDQIF